MAKQDSNEDDKPDRRAERETPLPRVTKLSATKALPPLGEQRPPRPKRTRKVKFADPLTEHRLYDKAASPKAEMERPEPARPKAGTSTINDLEPPLSLVAQLDLAAKKLDARSSKIVDADQAPINLKSVKSVASLPVKNPAAPTINKDPPRSPTKKI